MNPAEAYILKQLEPYKSILLHLQVMIEHVFPDAELLCKWKIPCYYSDKKPICYLNQSNDYVDIAFWHSAHLSKKFDKVLVSENRKVVKSLRYKNLEEVDNDILLQLLNEIKTLQYKGFYKKTKA